MQVSGADGLPAQVGWVRNSQSLLLISTVGEEY